MKTLKVGDTGRTDNTVDEKSKSVTMQHTSVHPSLSKGARFQLCWTIDLSKLSSAQILVLAAETLKIRIKRGFKEVSKPGNDDWNNVSFDGAEFDRVKISGQDRDVNRMAKYSDKELAEMGFSRIS